ncbi:MAG: prepilin-type N-terminal cleavage/methylation domain-containing protein [Dehalococcoidia bacterium]
MRKLLQNSRGFTLVEMLVGVGVLVIVVTAIGAGIFQSLGTHKGVVDDGLAINELRKGFSWFAGDVQMARTTDLVDGAPSVSTVNFTWTDEFEGAGVTHTSSYSLTGDRLVRTYDGNSHTVAHRVVSVAFSLSSRTVTAQLEVDAGSGTTRVLTLNTLMRSTAS